MPGSFQTSRPDPLGRSQGITWQPLLIQEASFGIRLNGQADSA